MSGRQTWRVLVDVTSTHYIDIAAGSEAEALLRAERRWDSGGSRDFTAVVGSHPDRFAIDHYSSEQLADVAAEDRARWARKALHAFRQETGSDRDRDALCDLIADLGPLADDLGLDYAAELRRAADSWADEKQPAAEPEVAS